MREDKTNNKKGLIIANVIVYSLLFGLVFCSMNLNTEYSVTEQKEPIIIIETNYEHDPLPPVELPSILIDKHKKVNYCNYLSNKYEKPYEHIQDISIIADKYSEQFDFDANTLMSLIGVESRFNEKANSYLGSEYGRGLCQVSKIVLTEYNWHNKFGDCYLEQDLYDIDTNIKIASWYLNRLQNHYKINNIDNVLSAYNRGPNDKGFSTAYVNNIKTNLQNY